MERYTYAYICIYRNKHIFSTFIKAERKQDVKMPTQFDQIPHSHPKSQYGASQIITVVRKRICIFAYMFEKYI